MKKGILLTYPAIFTKEGDSYWVKFIDLDGCFSDGKTLAETMENAKEAMGLYLEDLSEYPECTTDFSNIHLNEDQIISFVSINMEEHRKKYDTKSVKKTLSIPAWLNTMAENQNINFSQLLQSALMERLNIDKITKQ
ncbi:MAG: type II toxin-antitoxin system HicB family antitoxin [Clostridia bacterium]